MIGLLRAGELPDQVIAYACDLLPLYVMAIAYEESLYGGEENSPEQVAAYITDMRDYFESLPAQRFPNLVSLAGPLTSGDGDERFEFGLDVLVRGLAAMRDYMTRIRPSVRRRRSASSESWPRDRSSSARWADADPRLANHRPPATTRRRAPPSRRDPRPARCRLRVGPR
jgi:hypothetical protein